MISRHDFNVIINNVAIELDCTKEDVLRGRSRNQVFARMSICHYLNDVCLMTECEIAKFLKISQQVVNNYLNRFQVCLMKNNLNQMINKVVTTSI